MFPSTTASTTLSLIAITVALVLSAPTFADIRTFDGSGNHMDDPLCGAAGTPLIRMMPAEYPDSMGVSIVEMPTRENPRVISNRLAAQAGPMPSRYGLTSAAWHWGQFIDHDFSLTEPHAAAGTANISTPPGDMLGPSPIPFTRSTYDHATGDVPGNPRQQMNAISSYLDASMVYGSDADRAAWLREGVGGRLRLSDGNLLPWNDGTQTMAGLGGAPSYSTDLFVAGDVRANVQIGLTAMHTVFAREHNRLAGLLAAQSPGASDEDIYQAARRIVGAEVQIITYNEFLPAMLGDAQLPPYTGYQADVDPSIANEFSTALFRVGHTMLNPSFALVDADGATNWYALRDAYFNPAFHGNDPENIDRVLRGLRIRAQEIDQRVVDDVRNFLFGPPGSGGMDLASLNLQRGRDHGLPDYNEVRHGYGLLPKVSFLTDGVLADGITSNGITTDPELAAELEAVYGSIDNVDLWMGALSEDHRDHSGIGELLEAALIDQFTRLRDGDRFFYLNDPELTDPWIQSVIDLEEVTLSSVLAANTGVYFPASINLFLVPEPASLVAAMLLLVTAAAYMRNRH